MLSSNKKNDFILEISNVIYLLEALKHDKANIKLRLELAENLENLNNITDALFHLFIAYELDSANQDIISKIVINLIRMNDYFEAKKWALRLNPDSIEFLKEFHELFEDKYDINKLIYFGFNFLKFPYCLSINSNINIDDFILKNKKKINDSKFIYLTKEQISIFDKFYNIYSENLENIFYIFSETDEINNVIKNEFVKLDYQNNDIDLMISNFLRSLSNAKLSMYFRNNLK